MVTLEDLRRARQRGDREAEDMARQRLRVYDVDEGQVGEFLRTGRAHTEMTIRSPLKGHVIKKYQREGNFVDEGTPLYDVADLDTVWVQAQVYEADQSLLREGLPVTATTLGLPGREFAGTLNFVYPHLDESSRTLTIRFRILNPGHLLRPGGYATVRLDVPPSQIDLFGRALAEDWARQNAVEVVAHALASPAGPGAGAGLASLAQAAVRRAALARGLVPAVPDSAVIDTGSVKLVYRETAPGTYEGVLVRLGPRMAEPGGTAALYPVLGGLELGDRVVTNGSFLVDAETRLNPAAGSIYSGGSGGKGGPSAVAVRPSTPEDEAGKERRVKAEPAEPAPADRRQAESQTQANLNKLGAEDRPVAAAQKYCPVSGERLGDPSMGVPFRVRVQGEPVFLCCKGCRQEAVAHPDDTLRKVGELKARARAEAHRHH
jgi:multidrug efflux pump subunit AcrA (membrane-fusion protein)